MLVLISITLGLLLGSETKLVLYNLTKSTGRSPIKTGIFIDTIVDLEKMIVDFYIASEKRSSDCATGYAN
jgi:hypothetical protein